MVELVVIGSILAVLAIAAFARAQLARLKAELEDARRREADALGQWREESARRAAAEERAALAAPLSDRIAGLEMELAALRADAGDLRVHAAQLERDLNNERKFAAEKMRLVETAQAQLTATFKAASAEAIQAQSQQLLQAAQERFGSLHQLAKADLEHERKTVEQLVLPVHESLQKVDARLQELEVTRAAGHESLLQHVRSLAESEDALRRQTARLVTALRTPHVRGRWGEEQLRRVVEIAGMSASCDFSEQATVDTDEGRQRPDLVVRLAGGRSIVVDAKVPLTAFLDAVESTDEDVARARLRDHVSQVRTHVSQLARKAYWSQFDRAPEFVVLFLSDAAYAAALQVDPELATWASGQKVLLTTPTQLIGLLRTVALAWREERVAETAKQIGDLGRELHKRLIDVATHVTSLGRSLQGAVDHFNKAVGSLERRVFVTARKFRELDAADAELEPIEPIVQTARVLNAPELIAIEGGQKSGTEG